MQTERSSIVLAAGILAVGLLTAAHTPIAPVPGDPIPDIDIVVEQHPGGQSFHSVTDANGTFSFTVPPGSYSLRIDSRPGVARVSSRAAPVTPGAGAAWPLIALPDSVATAGGWPYRLRFAGGAAAITRISFAAPAPGTAGERTTAPAARALEVWLVVASPSGAGAPATRTLHGRVESRR